MLAWKAELTGALDPWTRCVNVAVALHLLKFQFYNILNLQNKDITYLMDLHFWESNEMIQVKLLTKY